MVAGTALRPRKSARACGEAISRSIQVADGRGVVIALAEPRQLRGVRAIEPAELAQLVEREAPRAQALAAVEQGLEALGRAAGVVRARGRCG